MVTLKMVNNGYYKDVMVTLKMLNYGYFKDGQLWLL